MVKDKELTKLKMDYKLLHKLSSKRKNMDNEMIQKVYRCMYVSANIAKLNTLLLIKLSFYFNVYSKLAIFIIIY